jgi:hypothetical protein
VCPHQVANLRNVLRGRLGAGDDVGARRTCERILRLDPKETRTRATLVGIRARQGDDAGAEAELARLVGPPSAAPPLIRRARQALADALWQRSESAEAASIYAALLEEPLRDEDARQLEVRLLGIEAGGEVEETLRDLLAPRRTRTVDAVVLLHAIERLDRVRDDGLAAYLRARQLLGRQRHGLALPELERALDAGLPTPRIQREARRLRAQALVAEGRWEEAGRAWWAIQADPATKEAARVEAHDFLVRVRWSR